MPTAIVEVSVIDVLPSSGGRIIALASAELLLDGVAFILHGIQVIRVRTGVTEMTGVDLPRYRALDGQWRPAIDLPPELREPLADAVLERCCELGITKRVDGRSATSPATV